MRTASAATRCRGDNLETIHVYKQKKKKRGKDESGGYISRQGKENAKLTRRSFYSTAEGVHRL